MNTVQSIGVVVSAQQPRKGDGLFKGNGLLKGDALLPAFAAATSAFAAHVTPDNSGSAMAEQWLPRQGDRQ